MKAALRVARILSTSLTLITQRWSQLKVQGLNTARVIGTTFLIVLAIIGAYGSLFQTLQFLFGISHFAKISCPYRPSSNPKPNGHIVVFVDGTAYLIRGVLSR